jgi:hypothetical protein
MICVVFFQKDGMSSDRWLRTSTSEGLGEEWTLDADTLSANGWRPETIPDLDVATNGDMYLAWSEEKVIECSETCRRVAVRIRDSTDWSDPVYVASPDLEWDPDVDSRSCGIAARGESLHIVWIEGARPNRKVMHRYFQPPGEDPGTAVLDPDNWSDPQVVNTTSGSDGALPKIYVDYSGRIYVMWVEHSYDVSPGNHNTELHLRYVEATATGVEFQNQSFTSSSVTLSRVRPNPSRGLAEVSLGIPLSAGVAGLVVHANVYDVRGVRVRTLVDRVLSPGSYRLIWEGTDDRGKPTGSGIYFLRTVVQNGPPDVQRLVLLR